MNCEVFCLKKNNAIHKGVNKNGENDLDISGLVLSFLTDSTTRQSFLPFCCRFLFVAFGKEETTKSTSKFKKSLKG